MGYIDNLKILKYTPREIHAIMGETSHGVIAHMNTVKYQEDFRNDPRFPHYQRSINLKRYADIFKGTPYGPIFANPLT